MTKLTGSQLATLKEREYALYVRLGQLRQADQKGVKSAEGEKVREELREIRKEREGS